MDTYHSERHPVAARAFRNTTASVALRNMDDRTEALRDVISELLSLEEPRKHFAAVMSGLDIRYDFGEEHPSGIHSLLGRRVPDLDLTTSVGSLRVYELLHESRPVLLDLGETGKLDL